MEQFTKVIIYDTEGNSLFDGELKSPFVGLQTGETFWFGNDNHKSWSRVIKITYGMETDLKCFVVEMVVERTENKATKHASSKTKHINHGQKQLKGKGGSTWSINNGDIVVTAGAVDRHDKTTSVFTLKVNSDDGTKIESLKDVPSGTYIEIKTNKRQVIATLAAFDEDYGGISSYTFEVTENIQL